MNTVAAADFSPSFAASLAEALERRGRALLEAPDLTERAAKLGTSELYFMVKELGVDEALPLLLAAGEQRLQALCDFDCWTKDRFDAADLDVWLAPFAQEGQEALARAFFALDNEVQILFLETLFEVFEGGANDNPHIPLDRPNKELPGALFTVVAKDRDGELDAIGLVDALVGFSIADVYQLLTALRWELPSALEEQAYQFRANRMMDLGFMEEERAAKLFVAPPKVLKASLPGPLVPQPMPAVYAAALTDARTLLHRGLLGVHDAQDRARLEAELVYLINGAVVAWGLTVRSLRDVHDAALWVRNVLSLALQALCDDGQGSDDGTLTGTLLGTPLLHLFQRGMADIMPLTKQAQQLLQQEGVRRWLEVAPDAAAVPTAAQSLEAADRAFVMGLTRGRPILCGVDVEHPDKRAMWQTYQELEASRRRLSDIAARFKKS